MSRLAPVGTPGLSVVTDKDPAPVPSGKNGVKNPGLPAKTCQKCHVSKETSEYHRNRNRPDGLTPWCKACVHAAHVARYVPVTERKPRALRAELLCTDCRERKPRDEFYKGSQRCKPCTKVRDSTRKRSSTNPDVNAAKFHKRRAAGTLDRFEVALLRLIEPTCRKCDKGGALHLDHIKPVKLGGLSEWENSQMLCPSCNTSKGATEADYRRLVMWV